MNTPKTIEQSETAVASSDLLDTKRYNQFTWWHESNGWTAIGDYDGNRIARWMRTLDEHEVVLWCDGYEAGVVQGIVQGKNIKSGEIRSALGV